MEKIEYQYLLPIFVGHPFSAAYTQSLRDCIEQSCIEHEKIHHGKDFLWKPEFLNTLESSRPASILDVVRETILQSALCIFEITDLSKANVFLELGIALGMNRSVVLIAQPPYTPPSDLHGIRRIEYKDMEDLKKQLTLLMDARLQELQAPPRHGLDRIHQKMQIDANWQNRLRTASKTMLFFAGDLSWAEQHKEIVSEACQRGVSIQICCRKPRDNELRKWQNLELMKIDGVEISLFKPDDDPGLRGFVTEPEEMTDITEVMIIEKQTRTTHSQNYVRTGITIGESRFLYTAHVYRGNTHRKHVTAIIKLFDSLWNSNRVERYWA